MVRVVQAWPCVTESVKLVVTCHFCWWCSTVLGFTGFCATSIELVRVMSLTHQPAVLPSLA